MTNALAKLQGKYGSQAAQDTGPSYERFRQYCRRTGQEPETEEALQHLFARVVSGYEAWQELKGIMADHAPDVRMDRDTYGAVLRVASVWSQQNGDFVWHVYELGRKAAMYLDFINPPNAATSSEKASNDNV